MGKFEERFWRALIRQRLKVFAVCATVLSLCARFAFRGFISEDMDGFLIPWYGIIRGLGGLSALSTQVGDYQIGYQTLIALLTYLPIGPVYSYKILSIIFDYALGLAAAATVRRISGSGTKAVIAYAVTVCLPVTVLNSAAWGQCDSMYTFFLVMTFLYLLKGRPSAAMLLYGMAFTLKLQAVFFLPFLLFYYVWSRKMACWQFLLIPVPLLVFSVGGLVQGRSLLDPILIYVRQSGYYQMISMNYPSFWNLLVETMAENGTDFYQELRILCMGTTVVSLGGIMLWLIQKNRLESETLLMIATLMMYTCVLLLPGMHERYAYPVLVFAAAACVLNPGMIPAALGMLMIDMQTYGQFLMQKPVPSWTLLIGINVACYAGTAYLTWKRVTALQGRENLHTA